MAEGAFDKLEQRGYLPTLRDLAMNMCASFFWSSQPKGQPATIIHNGTICFLKTPERRLGITPNHVYQKYLKDQAEQPDVEAQFGGNTIYPEKRLIDCDNGLDLATFDVPEIFVLNPWFFHDPRTWPPPKLQQKEMVLYGGYPGTLKKSTRAKRHFHFSRSRGESRT